MTWKTLIDKWLEEQKLRHYSDTTRRISRRWLYRLARFAEENGLETPEAFADKDVDAFRQSLVWHLTPAGRLYTSLTVDQGLRMVRTFFSWATRNGHLLVDPCRNLVLRRLPRPKHPTLTVEQIERLMAVPDLSTTKGVRNFAILELLYGTGIRRGECATLNVDDVDLQTRILRIGQAKRGRGRYVPIGENLARAIDRYLQKGRPAYCGNPDEKALFLTKEGTRYSIACLTQMLWKVAQQARIPKVSCHSLRHAFATHLLRAGADVEEVQILLGHAHLQSTHRYTQVDPIDLAEEHRRTHPREETQG